MSFVTVDKIAFDMRERAFDWSTLTRYSLLWRFVILTVVFGCILVALVGLYTPSAVVQSAIDQAVSKSLEEAEQMRTLRAFYSKNVVAKAVHGGGKASASYKGVPDTIPVPTTFIQDVAEAFSAGDMKLRLVSPYPWPTRAGRVLDPFQRDAWALLQADPTSRVVRREIVQGREILRVAVGDRMDASCVACHNSSPLSPKRDWRVGDVRGVIEIDRPIDQITTSAHRLSWRLSLAVGTVGLLLLLAVLTTTLRTVAPMRDLAAIIERIAKGWLRNDVPHLSRRDELGSIARALANLQEQTSERLKAEAKIKHMAVHDELTGLPNRVFFQSTIASALESGQEGFAVHCFDLDRFKTVNDTLGHPAGDQVLREVGRRLTSLSSSEIFVARNGGDEFALIQFGIDDPTRAATTADEVIDLLSAPYLINGQQVFIGVSIGIALAPADGNDAEDLLRNADLALYRAKSEGRCTKRFFERGMDAQMQARRRLELDLRSALISRQLELYYQPIVSLSSKEITGFEALLRWHHPQRGMVPPTEFIPLAEETGEIDAIGEWVLRTACREATNWPDHVKVAVNLSPMQFRSGSLPLHVIQALAQSGLSPTRLELEITESVVLQDTEATLKMLHDLRGLGVSIAMDDFGTGYSSLSYLRKFPFDKIKIDRSFISDLEDGSDAAAIVKAVMGLGSGLGMATLAEGVETKAQFDSLNQEGCDEVQGYFISPPRPASRVRAMLEERQRRVA